MGEVGILKEIVVVSELSVVQTVGITAVGNYIGISNIHPIEPYIEFLCM